MKEYLFVFLTLILLLPINVYAKSGCCSHHGGVAGCSSSGRQVCNDGTLSPSCTCYVQKKEIEGCTDSKAINYNRKATKNDGSCNYYVYGCMDSKAINYNSMATKDDGTCKYTTDDKNNTTGNPLFVLLTSGGLLFGICKYFRKKI